jgi:phosphoribosyl 1,2-cyclic phosphodiesterase
LTLTFQSLCSGSSGNSLLLKTEGSALLIDAGFPSMRAGRKALNGYLSGIEGVVISHLHSDHIQHASLRLLEESRIPIYLYEKDIKPLAGRHFRQFPFLHLKIRPFSDRPFPIGDFSIYPFRLPHDGIRPTFGFAISLNRKGRQRKVVVATDFRDWGGLPGWFADSDFIYVEANHDPELLRVHPNPRSHFHLSNVKCGRLLKQVFAQSRSKPSTLMLGHLSEKRNRPELAQGTVSEILAEGGHRSIEIRIAPRYEPSEWIPIGE